MAEIEVATGIIIAVLSGLGGFVTAIITAKNSVSKARADAIDSHMTAMAGSLSALQMTVKTLQDENARLHECVEALEAEQRQLKAENETLKNRVDELERENTDLRMSHETRRGNL